MRTYRLQIRIIQLAVLLGTVIILGGLIGNAISRGKNAENAADGNTSENRQVLVNTKIVVLGDSFTYGYPGTPDHSWPQRLADSLKITVVNKGKIEQTAKDLLDRFDQDVLSESPGRVIIFVGNGDALKGVALKDYQSHVVALVEKAKANHILPILALPLPYAGVQSQIKEFRDWEKEYAAAQQMTLLDFAGVLFDEQNKFLSKMSENGKYPSAKGYEVMGDYAARVLK